VSAVDKKNHVVFSLNTYNSLLDKINIYEYGGATRPFPKNGGTKELRGDPTVGPHSKV